MAAALWLLTMRMAQMMVEARIDGLVEELAAAVAQATPGMLHPIGTQRGSEGVARLGEALRAALALRPCSPPDMLADYVFGRLASLGTSAMWTLAAVKMS